MKFLNETHQRYLFLTKSQWRTGVIISGCVAIGVAAFTYTISIWIPVTMFLVCLTIYHMGYASHFIIPFPHIAILISALQYVLAAWLGFYFPPRNPVYDVGEVLPNYLAYAAPVIIGSSIGWALSLARIKPKVPPPPRINSGLLLELDILLVVGVVTVVLARFIHAPSLTFVFLLVANLRYVGIYGRMLLRAPGWPWRLAIVLAAEVVFATETAMFHPLLLWSCWTFAVWFYCFRPSYKIIVFAAIGSLILLPALQEAKWRFRGGAAEDDLLEASENEVTEQDKLDKAVAWMGDLGGSITRTVTFNLSEDFISEIAIRYNQGWIVNRVMFWVPEGEPYAMGETLKNALVTAVVPRIFDPEKAQAGGRESMLRYAGLELGETTSMNLGYAGEMYANFGPIGGVVGCGLYAFVFGLGFRVISKAAFERPIWWSVVPFIFFAALKAEDGIAEVLNWSVKSCVVIIGLYFALPSLRTALTRPVSTRDDVGGFAPSPRETSTVHVD
jgi:hypothetical protein